ncbi:hypothetical protein B566_EDAN013850, partial [Ephemera danica]
MLKRCIGVLLALTWGCTTLTANMDVGSQGIDREFWRGVMETMHVEERVDLPDPMCVVCTQVAEQVLGWFAEGLPRDEIVNRTTNLCFTANMYPEHVCYGVIDSYA